MQSSTEFLGPKVGDVLHFLRSDAGVLFVSYLRQARPPLTSKSMESAALAGARCEGWEACVEAIDSIAEPETEPEQPGGYPNVWPMAA